MTHARIVSGLAGCTLAIAGALAVWTKMDLFGITVESG